MTHKVSISVMLVAALAAGCGGPPAPPNQPSQQAAAPAPVAVKTVKPEEKKVLSRTFDQPGQVEAYEQTPVYAKVSGYVREVKVDIGDHFQKGDVLARLWVPELEKEVLQKEAAVRQSIAEVAQACKAVTAAEARVAESEAGRARAQAAYDRWHAQFVYEEGLVRSKSLDQQSFEITRNQLKTAQAARDEVEAKVASAKADLGKAEADVAAAEARRDVARAERDRVQALLDYRDVVAPYDGRVAERHVDPGHLTQPGSGGTSKGLPLFVVVSRAPVRVYVDVPEADAVWVRQGDPAQVRAGGREFAGRVVRFSGALDPKDRTLRAEIKLDQPDAPLLPNTYVHATIAVTHRDVLTLPAAAVLAEKDQHFCFRVVDGVVDGKAVKTAVKMPVQVGLRAGGVVEVLARQVQAEDKTEWRPFTEDDAVVAGGLDKLTPGQAVRVP